MGVTPDGRRLLWLAVPGNHHLPCRPAPMNRHAPEGLLLDAAKVVELAEKIDQKKRDRLLFRLAREVLRADEVIARMGYQIMMLDNHLLSARASAQYWEGVTHTLQRGPAAEDLARAAELLLRYAAVVRDCHSHELERFDYLPEIEEAAENVLAAARLVQTGSPRRQQSGAINEGRDNSTAPLIPSHALGMMSDSHHLNQEPADFAAAVELLRLARKELAVITRAIHENNAKVEAECLSWACNERDWGERCPNCPLEYWIKL